MHYLLIGILIFTYLGHVFTLLTYYTGTILIKQLFYETILLVFILIDRGRFLYQKKYSLFEYLFLIYGLLSIALSYIKGYTIIAIILSINEWIFPVIFLFVIDSLLKNSKIRVEPVVSLTKVFIILNLLYAVLQVFLGYQTFSHLLFNNVPIGVEDFVQPDTGIRFSTYGAIFRPIGFFSSSTEYGSLSLLMLIIVTEFNKKARLLTSPYTYLAIFNIILSTSRASILGLMVYLFFITKNFKIRVITILVTGLMLIILVISKLMFLSGGSLQQRISGVWPYLIMKLNEGGFGIWFTGLGLGSSGKAIQTNDVIDLVMLYVDSSLLYIILISGLLGLFIYTGVIYVAGKNRLYIILPLFCVGFVSNIITLKSFIYIFFLILALAKHTNSQKNAKVNDQIHN